MLRAPDLVLASAIIIINILVASPAAYGLAVPSDGEGIRESGWRTLTKLNFSSEIRRHPHLLVIVTVPWSGESRSLMKEISHLIADKHGDLSYVKLRVVYRNSEKILADVLGATEGITFIYYRNSKSYKYQGHLRAHNILSSIYHIISLPIDEVLLKPLHTRDDLENFGQTTDKAVLLLEFCGWSAKLLHNEKTGDNETLLPVENRSDNAVFLGEKFTRQVDRTLGFDKKNQKDLEDEELTCEAESGFGAYFWHGEYTWANQSASQDTEDLHAGNGESCSLEEFQQFQSFFFNFTTIAREYYLPPERQRFGLISERSLVAFLGVDNPKTWSLMLHFPGCVNCSTVLQEGDDVRTFIQTPNSVVMELDVDDHNFEPIFPADRPSIILFVDRSSDSSEVRGDSKSSLNVLRRFGQENQLSYQIYSDSSLAKATFGTLSRSNSDDSGHLNMKHLAAPKLVNIKDKMAVMIIKQGERISLENVANVAQDNPAYDILSYLLHQENPAFKTKEKKISSLAKEVGFQLLSEDFEVQVIDSVPSHKETDQSEEMITGAVSSPEDQTSEFLLESTANSVSMNSGDLVKNMDITAVNDGSQVELADMETFFQQNQETVPYSDSNTCKFATKLPEEGNGESGVTECKQVDENTNSCMLEDLSSYKCQAENSFYSEEESLVSEEYIEQKYADQTDFPSNKACSKGVSQNLASAFSGMTSTRDDAADVKIPIITKKFSEAHAQRPSFLGSIFYSDGGYQLLRALTGGSRIPSLVILDPVRQQHYVFSEGTDINFPSLVNFVDEFLNGSLTPYRKSASPSMIRETPQPPFVNLDFHETDSVPRVTANTFCELVVGYKECKMGNELSSSNIQNFGSAWKADVLVAFSTSWCGFCQRMELIVREVYRAFKNYTFTLRSQSGIRDPMHIQDEMEDTIMNKLPSVFLMDCTENDCGSFLKQTGKKELYPALLLFPAENKSAISYEGDVSVVNVIEFLVSHGRNSQYLDRHKGFLWTHTAKGSNTLHDVSSASVDEQGPYAENKYNEFLVDAAVGEDDHRPIESHTLRKSYDEVGHVVPGSVLAATDKLINTFPFGNSTILIVRADQNQGFQGMIINNRVSWNIFKGSEELEPLKQAPLFYGGPIGAHSLPLVSLTRKPTEGFTKVREGLYFGDPVATNMEIKLIKSGERSAKDYWFFFGYSSWEWNQLFDELEDGAWHLTTTPVEHLDWPEI